MPNPRAQKEKPATAVKPAPDLSFETVPDSDESTCQQVMLIGPNAQGKTTQINTLPGKKFVYVFDPNCISSLAGRGKNIDFKSFIPTIEEFDLGLKTLAAEGKAKVGGGTVKHDKSRRKVEPIQYKLFEEDFDARCESGFFNDYDWLCLDSFTTFSDIVMDRAQFLVGRHGKHPEYADYTAQMNTIKNVMRAATAQKLHVLAIAHTERRKDDMSGKVYGHLIMTGQLRQRMPILFSQIFPAVVDTDKNGVSKYFLRTVPDRENPLARTNIPGLDPEIDVTLNWNQPLEEQGLGQILREGGKI